MPDAATSGNRVLNHSRSAAAVVGRTMSQAAFARSAMLSLFLLYGYFLISAAVLPLRLARHSMLCFTGCEIVPLMLVRVVYNGLDVCSHCRFSLEYHIV